MENKTDNESQPEDSGIKAYEVNGKNLTLYWKKYQPQSHEWHGKTRQPEPEEEGKKSAVLFNTGWSIAAQGYASKDICQNYANMSGSPTYTIEVRGDSRTIKQKEAAEAERRFIEENEFTDLTIVGNSNGGIRAVNTVALLQEKNPDINIKGLILLASMGLSEQNKEDFFKRFFNDPGGKIFQELAKHPIKNRKALLHTARILMEVGIGFTKDVIEARGQIPTGIENQRAEMITANPVNKEIKVPIVLLAGDKDTMSNPNAILPEELSDEAAKENTRRRLRHFAQTQPEDQTPEDIQESKKFISEREAYLKETLFPNSPAVRIVIAGAAPEKHGHHSILGYRAESAARASLGALDRLNGREK
jgi:pimeloyl-ACP methyl ester carboxylesterase